MLSGSKIIRPRWILLLGILLLFAIQAVWLKNSYLLTYNQIIIKSDEAFKEAREKEQAYRIPVAEIVNPGAVTIQSCGSEEVLIIRKCPTPDTIVYSNLSDRSLETFINQAFSELREHIVPLNIYCLADLFAGALHEKDIPISFVIKRFNKKTGEILETSLPSGDKQAEIKATRTFVADISETEAFRVHLQFSPAIVLQQMSRVLIITSCLLAIVLLCFGASFFVIRRRKHNLPPAKTSALQEGNGEITQPQSKTVYSLGGYTFDSGKNELQGFGETIQLNKKENAILSALCSQIGNVVERNLLLEENWGSSGTVYSRSLDTYITTLRKYLKQDSNVQIVVIKGHGYKLIVNECDTSIAV